MLRPYGEESRREGNPLSLLFDPTHGHSVKAIDAFFLTSPFGPSPRGSSLSSVETKGLNRGHFAEETVEEDWQFVSSHDCRRSWATWHLVERPDTVDVRTMMTIGGWSSYDAIEPYLDAPTERRIGRAMA